MRNHPEQIAMPCGIFFFLSLNLQSWFTTSCWDQWFPRQLEQWFCKGQKYCYTQQCSREHWKRVMQGHAGANLVPLVALNRTGKEVMQTERGKSEIAFYGNSFITGPMGEIVASANEKEEAVLVVEFDLANIKRKRHSWGIFLDRRPDLCKVLLTLDGSNPQT
ncbi:hypothetical protein NL676_014201 [Syzygium grande]|nr:hypothetical protein NL676_014201 [Syzygium grande]